ncbi:phosphodiester glycosidase family protein [Brevibacillus fulvus]|uniref:Exopolysaccharide biosynthesis protein n=1 Tax=Brevibacillus fulvus TaxID=1125967 RepID=A0A938Y147_9BACL|nr:exopolysaccharide biosynthesis protein [Brevibacillus fulvus]
MLGKFHRFCLFLFAPALGFIVAFSQADPTANFTQDTLHLPVSDYEKQTALLQDRLSEASEIVEETGSTIEEIQESAEKEKQAYEQQNEQVNQLLTASKSQTKYSADVLDSILSNLLGDPIGQTFGKNATIKVYSLEESGYSGYMAKVRLTNPNALKVVLANDQVKSRGETTSHAAKRKGAVLAINAGGFNSSGGYVSPIGITVVDGQIKTFSTNTNLSFVGFNNKGRLVGGKVTSKEQIQRMGVLQGASFLPTLLQDGKKMKIPSDWANAKHPRTLIGHFDNGDLLFIVIDGRGRGGSQGVTLEEAQRKLLEFHVRDAYNLDGGGSSAFYYKGRVLNHPSDGRERPVTSNIVILP